MFDKVELGSFCRSNVKDMYILTANISEMARDRANIAIVIENDVLYGLLNGIFTFDIGSF